MNKKKSRFPSKVNISPFLYSFRIDHFLGLGLKSLTFSTPEWIPGNLSYREARVLTDMWSPFSFTKSTPSQFWVVFCFVWLGCDTFQQEVKSRRQCNGGEKVDLIFSEKPIVQNIKASAMVLQINLLKMETNDQNWNTSKIYIYIYTCLLSSFTLSCLTLDNM